MPDTPVVFWAVRAAVSYTHLDGAFVGQLLTEGLGITVAREVQDGLCAHVDGAHDLLHLDVVVLAVAGDAEVDVDFGAEHGACLLYTSPGPCASEPGRRQHGDPEDYLHGRTFLRPRPPRHRHRPRL